MHGDVSCVAASCNGFASGLDHPWLLSNSSVQGMEPESLNTMVEKQACAPVSHCSFAFSVLNFFIAFYLGRFSHLQVMVVCNGDKSPGRGKESEDECNTEAVHSSSVPLVYCTRILLNATYDEMGNTLRAQNKGKLNGKYVSHKVQNGDSKELSNDSGAESNIVTLVCARSSLCVRT